MCAALFALLFDVLFISCLSDLKVKQPAKGKKSPFISAKGAQLCKLGWQSCPGLPEGSVCLHLPWCSAPAEELLSPSPQCLPSSESKALTFCNSWAQSLFHVSVYQNHCYWGWEGETGHRELRWQCHITHLCQGNSSSQGKALRGKISPSTFWYWYWR